jgi:hypothetical protein
MGTEERTRREWVTHYDEKGHRWRHTDDRECPVCRQDQK